MVTPLRPLQNLHTNIMPTVCKRTVQRRLKEKNIQKHRQRLKPLLTGVHRSKRLEWALAHESWTYDDWAKVVCSDECSIELGSGHGRPWVFHRVGAELEDTDYVESRKRVKVMIWAAIYGDIKSEAVVLKGDPESARGGITAERYLNCLKENLPRLMEGEGKIFMHDGAGIHTANIVKDWLSAQGYTVMSWPPYSPDLNPIEHLWFPTKEGAYPFTEDILELVGEENQKRLLGGEALGAWDRIPRARVKKLIESMPRRVKAVIKAAGGHTRY